MANATCFFLLLDLKMTLYFNRYSDSSACHPHSGFNVLMKLEMLYRKQLLGFPS